jgi:hypothetical protein
VLLWASDNRARVYDARTGEPVGPALRPALSKDQYVRVNPNECAISPDGRRLVFYENGLNTVRLWDADRAEPLLAVPLPGAAKVSRMWFSPDGSRVSLVVERTNGTADARSIVAPRFDVPAETTGPLLWLLTGQRIDKTDGIEFIDVNEFRRDPGVYRRAYMAWKGQSDDPDRQPLRQPR